MFDIASLAASAGRLLICFPGRSVARERSCRRCYTDERLLRDIGLSRAELSIAGFQARVMRRITRICLNVG